MLELIYNDDYTSLSILNKPNDEKVVIVDDDFKVYATISYALIQPSEEDYKKTWREAVNDYFNLNKQDETLKAYREKQSTLSIVAFDEWLSKGGMY